MSDASDRLARSRLAIIEHAHRREVHGHSQDAHGEAGGDGEPWDAAQAAAAGGSGGRFERVKRAAKAYWRHHPARMGLQIAQPLLARYAARHPGTYLSIAAAAGALFVFARPWRLISVTGVLVALAKSPQIAGVVMSALSGADAEDDGMPL